MPGTGTLEMAPPPKALLVGGVVLLVTAAVLAWWRTGAPEALPTSEDLVPASTKVGSPVYVGVFTAGSEFTRTLHLSGVKVHATSNTSQVTLTPHLCRGGSLGVTTEPEVFCPELLDPEGQTFGSGDGIVVEVAGSVPGVAVIDPVRLAFRENLHWATLPAGTGAVVQILPR
ncbi:hypothetical protein ABFT23_08110 [Nocardioides sp. C4-1]|uniref:hypothetical protein n=1 Tax=Nocardioides sp. C4-1 TaxID=3151851 RepID=UPI0032645E30